jgi:hypothetical protein
MRENRPSGSEGGVAQPNAPSLPLFPSVGSRALQIGEIHCRAVLVYPRVSSVSLALLEAEEKNLAKVVAGLPQSGAHHALF